MKKIKKVADFAKITATFSYTIWICLFTTLLAYFFHKIILVSPITGPIRLEAENQIARIADIQNIGATKQGNKTHLQISDTHFKNPFSELSVSDGTLKLLAYITTPDSPLLSKY